MIPLFSPFIPKETGDEVKRIIDSGKINRGSQATLFEQKLRKRFRFPYVYSLNSCTSALRLSLAIAGIKHGDQVLTTPWTMIATNTAILEQGAIPIFVDIEYDTLNMNLEEMEEKITSKTKALIVVHYAGYPCDYWKAQKIAIDHDLVLIQDCAQSLGAKVYGKYVGSYGTFNCFSFQTIKTITMGDGGCISTSRKQVYDEVVKRSWFGINKSKRIQTPIGTFPDDIDVLGYKYNITDIDATIGLIGLKHINEALTRRKSIVKIYIEELEDLDKIELLHYRKNIESSNWLFPIHVEERNSFGKFMFKNDIEVSKHNERNDKYTIFGGKRNLSVTSKVDSDIIHLPIYPSLSDKDLDFIIKKVKEWDKL